MINLSEGELLDMLPAQMKYDTDMQCLSYALKKGVDKLLEYERGSMTVNFIDSLPEKILDVLAVEMRSPYYLDDMDIEMKRQVIKNTYIWHFKAGTPSAVREMVEVVFGSGSVTEWPDFDEGAGEPYTFDINTNAQMTADAYEVLLSIVDRVKNLRSHLRQIKIERDVSIQECMAACMFTHPKITIGKGSSRRADLAGREMYAVAALSSPKITVA